METNLGRLESAVRYWRVLIIIGLFLVISGIAIFFKPVESYLTLNSLFCTVLIFSGVYHMIIKVAEKKTDMGSWTFTAGIFEILVGISLLIFSLASEITLPFVLGFWVMLRAVFMLGTAMDLKNFKIPGWGWMLAGGIADLILVFGVLYIPAREFISLRVIATLIFIVGGFFDIILALKYKNIKSQELKSSGKIKFIN
jgi:uncharacterized membrane protein HdeD (DUF308 family)